MNEDEDFRLGFGSGDVASQYTGSGWSEPELGERWCVGTKSALRVPVIAPGMGHTLVLNVRPFTVPGRLLAQTLKVTVNGWPVASFRVTKTSVRSCRIPAAASTGQPWFDIAFETPDAAKPAEISPDNKDSRQLALAFSTLLLYPERFDQDEIESGSSSVDPIIVDAERNIMAATVPASELMFQFEGLGQNCEFGLVQRQCGAEPLGLLRFSSTPLPRLLTALGQGFAGFGDDGNLDVALSSNGREYMVHDRKFGFLYHAWVKAGEMSPAAVLKRELRRVPLLVRKLLEDLAAAEKIFVYKGMTSLPEEEVYPLAVALRRFGPNALLLVNLADHDHPVGSVEVREPGFLVGYIERFAPAEDAADLCLDQWVAICREACRLRGLHSLHSRAA